jgi:hypothetical protein
MSRVTVSWLDEKGLGVASEYRVERRAILGVPINRAGGRVQSCAADVSCLRDVLAVPHLSAQPEMVFQPVVACKGRAVTWLSPHLSGHQYQQVEPRARRGD